MQEPDSLYMYPGERRVRGRARGPYDWHPDKSGAGRTPCTTTVRRPSAWKTTNQKQQTNKTRRIYY
eukprot:3836448-Heterocapsa_arctica.AAC.1